MRQLFKLSLISLLLFSLFPLRASAVTISLQDWVFNIDGNVSSLENGDSYEALDGWLIDGELANSVNTISFEISTAGNHSVIGFFDFEIDEIENTFFANEYGQAVGIARPGQSWEIDEPGYYFGDILDNVYGEDLFGNPTNGLDNANGVPSGLEDDVSFALAWDFTLLENDLATIEFVVTDLLPSVDFYLEHYDNDSDYSLYFYSTLNIVPGGGLPSGPVSVNESGAAALLAISLLLMLSRRLARHRK